MNVDFPHCAAAAASPFAEGERIEVRGFLQDGGERNPRPTLSLEKGEADGARTKPGARAKPSSQRSAFAADLTIKILANKIFALSVIVGVGFWLLVIPAFTGALGANPAEKLLHQTGEIAIWTLGVVLSLSPLRVLFPHSRLVNALNRHRRAIGVSACVYGLIHFGFHLLYEGDAQLFQAVHLVRSCRIVDSRDPRSHQQQLLNSKTWRQKLEMVAPPGIRGRGPLNLSSNHCGERTLAHRPLVIAFTCGAANCAASCRVP